MKRPILLIATALLLALPLTCPAQEAEPEQPANTFRPQEEDRPRVFNGFSGGMLLHTGYGFASNPEELFRNGSFSPSTLANLPKSGIYLGIGGMMRFHLLRHLRVGGEGYVSSMPLRQNGQIRTGWGGVMADFYGHWGKFMPFIGGGIGGGSMRRTYVAQGVEALNPDEADQTIYNASFIKTPFFYLDPQIGGEFPITSRINIILRLDYLLPFGKSDQGISASLKNWSGFMSPSGPRLYVGFMFNH